MCMSTETDGACDVPSSAILQSTEGGQATTKWKIGGVVAPGRVATVPCDGVDGGGDEAAVQRADRVAHLRRHHELKADLALL